MSTVGPPKPDERVRDVEVTDQHVTFHLFDGRIVSIPLSWSSRLQAASTEERQNFVISGSRHGVHWPDVDEDLSGAGALRGSPAPRLSFLPTDKNWTSSEVRKLRLQAGMTITAFAKRLGVRRATVSDWERGRMSISSISQRLLEDFLARLSASDSRLRPPDSWK